MVIGVVGLLTALLLPALGSSRRQARQAVSLSNIRQCGIGVIGYSLDYADRPPVLAAPREVYYGRDTPDIYVGRGVRVEVVWWDHELLWHYLLNPPPSPQVAMAPWSQDPRKIVIDGSPTAVVPDYYLALSLYADPAYWDRFTQAGPSQWRAQRLTDIRFPSDKGLMWQQRAHAVPGSNAEGWQHTVLLRGEPTSVLWSDASGNNLDFLSLHAGEPNFFHHSPRSVTYFSDGWPVAATRHGIHGRDRGGVGGRKVRRDAQPAR